MIPTSRSISRLCGLVAATVALLVPLLLTGAPDAEASHSSNPCPSFALSDVWADPNGDWDRDRLTNRDEIYSTTTSPCVRDSGDWCSADWTWHGCLPEYRTYVNLCATNHWYWYAINTAAHYDWDHDGVSNRTEALAGANPCRKPCPSYHHVDVQLNPRADWDRDGYSNSTERAHGTNPCSAHSFNPCPTYTHAQVNLMPHADWDGDGYSNQREVWNGTNPCSGYSQRLPHVTTLPAPTPHPAPQPGYVCPPGYPYYHPGNGLCYANPVRGH